MSDDDKIWADANEPDAHLIDDGNSTHCATLGEAIMEWERLPKDRQKGASVRTANRVFTAADLAKGIYQRDSSTR